MKRWGLRASSQSAVTKAYAGQNTSSNHLNPNVLYMMLQAGVYLFINFNSSFKSKEPQLHLTYSILSTFSRWQYDLHVSQ